MPRQRNRCARCVGKLELYNLISPLIRMCASQCNSTSLAIWLESCSVPSKVFRSLFFFRVSFSRPLAYIASERFLLLEREFIYAFMLFPGCVVACSQFSRLLGRYT